MLAETYKKTQDRKNKKAVFINSRTRATNAKAQEDYSKANREVKKSVRRDKREYLEGLTKKVPDQTAKERRP